MHFKQVLPNQTEELRAWSIYDLVDDWILHTAVRPGRQILLYVLCIAGVTGIMVWLTSQITSFPALSIGLYVVIQVGMLFVTITLHELCHAFMIVYYGGTPRFGAKWMKDLGPVVYATTNGYLTVYAYRHIAAAPLIIISILCMVGILFGFGWWVIIPFIFNALGAGGDLLSLRVLKRYPDNYLIQDTEDGFTVYRDQYSEKIGL